MRNLIVVVALILMNAPGCGSIAPPRACTLIGCENGVTVELNGTLPQAYTVTARVNGQIVATVQCDTQRPCAGGAFLAGVTAPRVEIEVSGTGVNVRREVTPSYVTSQPNGPDCPPTCTQARVRIDV